MTLQLQYGALSDVGRVRKDNQDSGYAGPWLLTVCDGVGGAARGDIASATAVQQLRKLDTEPHEDLLGLVAGAIHRAHDRIGELVEEDASLAGTSTTLTAALFDGEKLALGHVGDSRAYLFRSGELTQLTKDHTFVQSLIDEGRLTDDEAKTHPHRNLILKAVDGVHEAEPDLFQVDVQLGDRILLCSDGACGFLDDARMADILGTLTVDYAVVEMIRASLDAGSTDNVTVVVAEVVDGEVAAPVDGGPLLVGAAAELPRRKAAGPSLFRGHRSGDTGEMEAVESDLTTDLLGAHESDPVDPEVIRYAPRAPRRFVWLKRFAALAIVAGLVWAAAGAAYAWSQRQYFVADHDGTVTIFRGVDADLPGVTLRRPYETSDVDMGRLSQYDADLVRRGIEANSLADARRTVQNLATEQSPCEVLADPSASASPTPTGSASPTPTTAPDC